MRLWRAACRFLIEARNPQHLTHGCDGFNKSVFPLNHISMKGISIMQDFRVWISAVALLFAGWMLYPVLAGDGTTSARESDLQEVVYICQESGETFLLRAKSASEKHPKTGRPTLMPGLYCEKCGTWRASPPLDVLQQSPSARLCPKDRSPMTTQGPRPDNR
jgi:hypothetical protein